jgi:hypothetical protein
VRRTFVLFGGGLVVGAAAMFFAGGRDDATAPDGALERTAMAPTAAGGERVPRSVEFLTLAIGSVSVAERAALLRLAAEADRRTLEDIATQVAVLPNLAGRRLALEVLFTRYAELDGQAALDFAQKLALPADALAPLFSTWARRDANGALRALGDLDPAMALTLGVAVLDVLGNDGLGIARVLGAASQIDADRFRIEAAVAKTAAEPEEALDDALLLPPSKARLALDRMAVIWSDDDVHGALSAAERIGDDDLRNAFKAAVMRAWARTDPEALIDYVLDLGAEEREEALRSGALQAFSLVDPERALRAAEGISGQLGTMIRRAGLMSLAEDDPLAAIRMVEQMPLGRDREQVLTMIAASYGRLDANAALAWAQSLSPPSSAVMANVLTGLARQDPARAIELAFQAPPADQQRLLQQFVMNSLLSAEQTAEVANRLLAAPGRGPALQQLTQLWAQRQPRDALTWLLANGAQAPEAAVGQAAMSLARTDPSAAIGYLDTVPRELRARWISAVADGYAQTDARAAAGWIQQHRGEAGYDAAVAAIAARTAAAGDAAAGARLLASIDLTQAPGAPASARQIANAWAREDPAAAAAWAHELRNNDAETAATATIANQWVARDPVAVRNWTFGLPSGAPRDAALVQLLGATAGTPAADPAVLEAFSTAEARQRGVNEAVRVIMQRDPAAARELADRYITDPGTRQATERFFEQGGPQPMPIGPGPPRLPAAR